MTASPQCSVIVPVFNQWHLVPNLLRAMEAQTWNGDFELLLIDNGSDAIPELSQFPAFAQVLECREPGSYAARNYGAMHARGHVLAFTDADCIPDAEWLDAALECLAGTAAENTLVAGNIRIFPADPAAPNRYELYDMMLGMPQELYVRRGYAITANLFMHRELFERMNGFDANRFSGGDADFCRRAINVGAALVFCRRAIVRHPARDDFHALRTKVRRVKGGQLSSTGRAHWRLVYTVRAFLPPVRAWVRTLRASQFTRRQRSSVCLIQARLWVVEMVEVVRLVLGGPPERR